MVVLGAIASDTSNFFVKLLARVYTRSHSIFCLGAGLSVYHYQNEKLSLIDIILKMSEFREQP